MNPKSTLAARAEGRLAWQSICGQNRQPLYLNGGSLSCAQPCAQPGVQQERMVRTPEANAGSSVALFGWQEISKMRANNKGNKVLKAVAELGYLSNGFFAVVESVGRLPAYYVVTNPLSRRIARIANFFDKVFHGRSSDSDVVLKSYEETCRKCVRSFDNCVQAVCLNFASVGLNMHSHERNMKEGRAIYARTQGCGEFVMDYASTIEPERIAFAATLMFCTGLDPTLHACLETHGKLNEVNNFSIIDLIETFVFEAPILIKNTS